MDATWRRSSYSGNQGHCVEARRDAGSRSRSGFAEPGVGPPGGPR
ncbi:DUF397 domain-containing protein [Nocardiopsis sp. NPDC007018]